MKFLLLLSAFLTVVALAEDRVWTSVDGKKITGEWQRDESGAVVLKVKGKEFTVPLKKLSAEDIAWLEAEKEARRAKAEAMTTLAGTTKTYKKGATHKVTFHVYYPTSYSGEKKSPMIILFSPSGNGKNMLNLFQKSCEELGWIGVGCDTFRNRQESSEMDPLFAELLPVIEKTVSPDPEKYYFGGFSGGAMRSFEYSVLFERPWKGIVSCGGWLGKRYDLKYPRKMAVAWVNGDKDKNANGWVEKDTDVLKKRRCKTKLFPFPGGHKVGPPETLTEAMRWIEENTVDVK